MILRLHRQLRPVVPALLFLLLALAAVADDQVRAVQVALRKRDLFYGQANGETTPALTRALVRFQERRGLPATGEINPETLASLHLAPGQAKAADHKRICHGDQHRGATAATLDDVATTLLAIFL